MKEGSSETEPVCPLSQLQKVTFLGYGLYRSVTSPFAQYKYMSVICDYYKILFDKYFENLLYELNIDRKAFPSFSVYAQHEPLITFNGAVFGS